MVNKNVLNAANESHLHHGIEYRVTPEGRCAWYSCINNMYNGDYPEETMAKAYAKAVVTYTTYYEIDLNNSDCEGTENHEMTEEDGSYSANDFNLCVEIDKIVDAAVTSSLAVHDLRRRTKPQITADVTLVDEAEYDKNKNTVTNL